MSLTRYQLFFIKYELDLIKHCGDYGRFYVNRYEPKVFLELGDADEVDVQGIKDRLPFDLEIIAEAECGPEDEQDWILVSRGIEEYENYLLYRDEFSEEPITEYHPNLLSVDEYIDYYKFFKTLKEE